MSIFAGGEAEYAIADRPARVPRRSLLLRARDLAGVALVAVWALLTVLFLTVVL